MTRIIMVADVVVVVGLIVIALASAINGSGSYGLQPIGSWETNDIDAGPVQSSGCRHLPDSRHFHTVTSIRCSATVGGAPIIQNCADHD